MGPTFLTSRPPASNTANNFNAADDVEIDRTQQEHRPIAKLVRTTSRKSFFMGRIGCPLLRRASQARDWAGEQRQQLEQIPVDFTRSLRA
jgi:hypothetical protein